MVIRLFNLPIIEVLKSEVDVQEQAWTEDGVHVNSGFLDGLNKADAIAAMLKWLGEKGCGKKAINYKLRDWIYSRQRYWGEPIPLVHCEKCGCVPIPEEELPVKLPDVKSYQPTGTGESPLAAITDWVNPYGSNYFMLNTILENKITAPISKVSGIVSGWNRSVFNKKNTALASLEEIVASLKARYIIVSYNSEGFITYDEMISMLKKYGELTIREIPYNTFRGSRNLANRDIHVSEYLFTIRKY